MSQKQSDVNWVHCIVCWTSECFVQFLISQKCNVHVSMRALANLHTVHRYLPNRRNQTGRNFNAWLYTLSSHMTEITLRFSILQIHFARTEAFKYTFATELYVYILGYAQALKFTKACSEAEFMSVQFLWGFWGILLRDIRLEFSVWIS